MLNKVIGRISLFRTLEHSIILPIYLYLYSYFPSYHPFLQPNSFLSFLLTTISLPITLIYIHITLFITFYLQLFLSPYHSYLQSFWYSTTLINNHPPNPITLPLPITIIYNHPSPHHSYLQSYLSPPPLSTTILLLITLIYNLTPPHHPYLQPSFSLSLFTTHHSYLQIFRPFYQSFLQHSFSPSLLFTTLPLPTTLNIYNHPYLCKYVQPITLIYNHSPFLSPLSTTILLPINLPLPITLIYNLLSTHHRMPPNNPYLQPSFSLSLFTTHHSYLQPFPSTHHFYINIPLLSPLFTTLAPYRPY